jgi:D-alanine--(R)-lactate ligase
MAERPPRLKVGIVFGGPSEEHPIAVKSAREIAAHLDLERYEPYYVGITKGGAWRLCDGPADDWEGAGGRPAALSPDREAPGLLVSAGGRCETIGLDLVFPVLHGRFGEDGAIQGLLELAGIPYVGCDIQSSALCMDKSLAYVVAAGAGIATPRFWTLSAEEGVDPDELTYPVFVKPARSGSSFGVSKVGGAEELPGAIEAARRYDSKLVIEEAVAGSEVGCALLGPAADPFVGEVDQIALSHGFFRIHQESDPESGSDNATVIVPADIPAGSRARVQATAKAIYRALGCAGLARVDMFLKEDGEVVLNEVNTFPGMTSYSRYPRMMAAAGVSRGELIDRLVAAALAGGRR